jgi:hypothetical protein
MKDYFCILAILITVVFTHSSFAAPLLSVSDLGISGLNRFWLVEVAPDPLLFTGGSEGFGSSLAVELAFEVTDGEVIDVSKNGADWPADNPGNNPFTGGATFGVVIDFTGDTVFAALGSEFFTTDESVEVMTIETTGTGLPTLSWGGHILLAGTINEFTGSRIVQSVVSFDGYQGSRTAGSDPAANFDTDGDVDGADFLRWQRSFGTMGGALKAQGDANVDGNVDAQDLAIWQTEYGTTPPLSAVNTVPEPATIILILLAALGVLGLRVH